MSRRQLLPGSSADALREVIAAEPLDRPSLRGFLRQLADRGELRHIEREVDRRFELGAYLWQLARGPAVLFEHVRGSDMPVVGNVLNSRERFGLAMGVPWRDVFGRTLQALDHPIPPELVSGAACQEVEHELDLRRLPVPTWFEHESGAYITAGVIVAHDPESGRRNVSIARVQVRGACTAFIGIAPNHHLSVFARRAAALGRKLDVAVTIGQHPAVVLASNLYLRPGDDEFDNAGALLGRPVPLVRCRSIDVEVPADSEIVLEGTLDPSSLLREGPVSEFHGLYQRYTGGPEITFSAITSRRNPIFQVITPSFQPEHLLIGAFGIAATAGRAVLSALPESSAHVVITEAGGGRLHAVVQLRNPAPGDPRKAMFAIWGHVNLVKLVTVVNEDIDPYAPTAVEYAMATRFRAERDVVMVPRVRGDRADPLVTDGLVAKMGLDATRKAEDREDWRDARPPQSVLDLVAEQLRNP
jgi:2,5-furandicarboxylate decarboxylase 1